MTRMGRDEIFLTFAIIESANALAAIEEVRQLAAVREQVAPDVERLENGTVFRAMSHLKIQSTGVDQGNGFLNRRTGTRYPRSEYLRLPAPIGPSPARRAQSVSGPSSDVIGISLAYPSRERLGKRRAAAPGCSRNGPETRLSPAV